MGMFNDTPQARALISYFVSTEAQTLVAKTGNWMSANKFVPVDAYPNPFTKRAAETLSSAKAVYYYGSSLMPSAMSDAFWKAVLRSVQQPDQLDSILAALVKVQKDTYKYRDILVVQRDLAKNPLITRRSQAAGKQMSK